MGAHYHVFRDEFAKESYGNNSVGDRGQVN